MKRSASSSKRPDARVDEAHVRSREAALLQGILKDAEQEIRGIEAQTDKSISEKKKAVEQQIQADRQETDGKISEQVAALEKKTAARISMDIHRITLRGRDRMFQHVNREVLSRLEDAIKQKHYPTVLQGWIVEAMIGLDVERAEVNASRAEKALIRPELLKKAEKRIQELTGRNAHLRKSDKAPLLSQGVVVESEDGHLVFNNQVSTRMLRYQSEIRKLIASALLGEGSP